MRCNYCEWRCKMPASICHMYEERDGRIAEVYPKQWTSYYLTKAEGIPLFHGWPNHQFLQLGAFNCNASCVYCINSRVAIEPEKNTFCFQLEPDRVVKIAQKANCSGIHFSINEVTVNLPSALAVAKEAKKKGLVVGCSSNGYFTQEAADMMLEHFDFFNISLKSLSDDYYRKHAGLNSAAFVKRNIEYLAASRTHLEVTTTVVQTVNDHEIIAIAEYLAGIDPQLPWHIFRLLPEYKMKDRTPPDIKEISDKVQECRKILPNTYFSNYIGTQLINTLCPSCGQVLIERICAQSCGAFLSAYNMTNSSCPNCGTAIKMIGSFCDTSCIDDREGRVC
jgi:pyruvate formate lyase activating enzyme